MVNDSQPPQLSTFHDETQRRGTLVLRSLPILLIPLIAAMITFVLLISFTGPPSMAPGELPQRPILAPLIPIVVLVIFLSALIILVRLGRPTLSALILIGVWTLLTTIGFVDSGVTSYWPALLIVPICAAGLLIDRVASISLAALATLLVASLAWLQTQGALPESGQPAPLQVFLEANAPVISSGFWSGLFWTVAGLTSLLAGGLQAALAQSRAHERELRELSAQLEARVATQTAQLLEQERAAATLEERARIAREIHDTLAQGLTGIVVQLGAAQRAREAAPDDMRQHLDLAHQMARESLAEARRSVWNLRAPALTHGDLGDALRGLASRPLRPDISMRFEQRGTPWPLSAEVEGALLRVCQEALVNVAKHARASHVNVMLAYESDVVRLTIQDDGVGFDSYVLDGATAPVCGGFGLLGMRERLTALGGRLELANSDGALVVAAVARETAEALTAAATVDLVTEGEQGP